MPTEVLSPSLTDRVKGLSRADAMKDVIGPHLTALLKPIYFEALKPKETDKIPAAESLGNSDALHMVESTIDLATSRAMQPGFRMSKPYLEFRDLVSESQWQGLFHYRHAAQIIEEGLTTGVRVPFVIAENIYRVENGLRDRTKWYFDPATQLRILQRSSCDKILQHLTKGPNGFLGNLSTYSALTFNDAFFDFGQDTSGAYLSVFDAYEVVDGFAADLNGAYHIAAHAKRESIHRRWNKTLREQPDTMQHRYGDSSGCPVRHRFADESGEPQPSLITHGKEFLIKVIAASLDKQGE